MNRSKTIPILMLLLILGHFLCSSVLAAPFSATAAVERTDLFEGEAFIFQIQVSGSENPERPDLSPITDFAVEFRGGQQNSNRSVTIVNGKVTQNVREGYVFSYQLTPKRTGILVIPSITVHIPGLSTQTEPISVKVKKPVETDDFKLKLKLSKNHCYVGEPITLTVTWYIGKDIKDFSFFLPLLESDDTFYFADPEIDMQSGKKLYRIPLGDKEAIGEKGRGRIDNKDFATITFKKILIPKRSGNVSIKPATVTCNALIRYERRRNRYQDDFFSDFFNDDFFGRSRRGVYRNMVVPSNQLSLRVSELPEKDRPAGFAGHVGEYTIKAIATPTEVSVGDPITLTVSLTGQDYLEYVKLPTLTLQPELANNFKIPKERATGEISGKTKVFTQTIRALRPDVKQIPAIELAYFDTRTGAYRVARTEPIPLQVRETRVVTALDAEGVAEHIPSGIEIETWSRGIAFNYEGMDVIKNQHFGPVSWFMTPIWMGMILAPPVMFLLLLTGVNLLRQRNADPQRAVARKAYGNLVKSLNKARSASSAGESCDLVLDAFRNYLGDKLRMPRGALTFNDVKDRLASNGVDQPTLKQLKELFEKCEAGRYAGTAGILDAASITEKGSRIAKGLEKQLK
jgi:hypothetical protein